MLHRVAACCSVLQLAASWCSVVQCGVVWCNVSQRVVYCSVVPSVATCCSMLQCATVYCSMLQCVAACCSVGVYMSLSEACPPKCCDKIQGSLDTMYSTPVPTPPLPPSTLLSPLLLYLLSFNRIYGSTVQGLGFRV